MNSLAQEEILKNYVTFPVFLFQNAQAEVILEKFLVLRCVRKIFGFF